MNTTNFNNANSTSTMAKQKANRADAPKILSSDTSVGQDLGYFIEKIPGNIFYMFYNPTKVNVDDMGRLAEKAIKKYYQPTLSTMNLLSFLSPRKKDGVKNLRAMDLDSYKYMEPILAQADIIALDIMEPLFADNDNSPYTQAVLIARDIKILSSNIREDGLTTEHQERYNQCIQSLHAQKAELRTQLQTLDHEIKKTLAEIGKIKVPGSQSGDDALNLEKSLKLERVKSLRAHLLRVEKQGVDFYRHLDETQKDLKKISKAANSSAENIGITLQNIGTKFDTNLTQTRDFALSLSDMSYTRLARKHRIRENGRLIGERDSAAEDHRKLKLGIDMNFVPDAPSKFKIVESATLDHNAENYFIMTVEYGLNNAFKDDQYVPFGQRGVTYGRDMAEYIAKMFTLGKPEDALYAIQLLKMAEGKESYQMFPNAFQEMVQDQLASFYGTSKDKIQDDPYAKLFIERVRDISGNRNHSPLLYGPRDTEARYVEKIKNYVYGRMYPTTEQFLATPLTQKMIQHPLIKMRGNMFAYITGGKVVDMADLNRPAKPENVLESEIGLGIKRTWWWAKKEAKSEDNPKPDNFFKRSPFWFKAPVRMAMVASVPAAIILVTGGAAAPLFIAIPVMATGAASGALYGAKAAKNTWALPFVNKPIKLAAKWTAIAALTAGTVYVAAPFAPAILAWGGAAALANPGTAAIIAAPFLGIAALKTRRISKNFGKKPAPPITFGEYQDTVKMEEDPLGLHDENGEFLTLEPEPEPIVIEIVETPNTHGQDSAHEFHTQNADTINNLAEEFMNAMRQQNEFFMDAMTRQGQDLRDVTERHYKNMEDAFDKMARKTTTEQKHPHDRNNGPV